MANRKIKEKILNENSSFIIRLDSPEDRYLSKKFGGEYFTTKIDDGNKIYSLKNSIGIIKVGNMNYRFYSKVSHLVRVFSMLEKIHQSNYSFKKNKSIWSFDPKVLVDVENGSSYIIQLIEIYISELWKLKRIGFSKEYNAKSENLNYLRGRMLLSKQIRRNVVPKGFYCKYNELNHTTPENLIVSKTINKILLLPISNKHKNELIYFKNEFSQFISGKGKVNLTEIKYKQNRLNKHYETIIYLSEIFLKGKFFSTLENGKNLLCNFLIKMDELFERYIFILIKELVEAKYPQYCVDEQVSLNFVNKYNAVLGRDKGYLNMIPDIIIFKKANNKPIVVIDTKYIDITNENKLNNSAYYQMLSYMFSLHLQNNSSITGVLLSHGTPGNTYRINHVENDHMYIYTESIDLLSNEERIKDNLISILDKTLGA
ncbi:hypothetical protein ACIGEL_17620 [Rossellomorea aquimaris]|uniref:5-methylcytosine restriction system specificity protein McrC n=1 Tax=Rossellomorea aquimaris TaxID=189382 RepID=UPI0037C760FB